MRTLSKFSYSATLVLVLVLDLYLVPAPDLYLALLLPDLYL